MGASNCGWAATGGRVFLGLCSVQALGSMLFLGFSLLPSWQPPGISSILGLRELKSSVSMGLVWSDSFWSFELYSLPDSSVHGTPQVRILEYFAISSSRGSSPLRDQTCVSCIAGGSFNRWAIGKVRRQKRRKDLANFQQTWDLHFFLLMFT